MWLRKCLCVFRQECVGYLAVGSVRLFKSRSGMVWSLLSGECIFFTWDEFYIKGSCRVAKSLSSSNRWTDISCTYPIPSTAKMVESSCVNVLEAQKTASLTRLVPPKCNLTESSAITDIFLSYQFIFSGIILLSSFAVGSAMIYPVVAIPHYKNETSTPLPHPMDESEVSWYGEL